MPDQKGNTKGRAQIALEFVIVYSFVLIIFVLMFTLVSTQKAATMAQQEYSLLQLQAQNIAGYIDQAIGAGSGYAATIPLAGSIGTQQFNISISTTGVVIAQTKVGTQIIKAFAFSNARNIVINGTPTQSGNGITVYLMSTLRGSVYIANSNGAIYVDTPPASTLSLAKSITISQVANTKTASFDGATSIITSNSAPLNNKPAFTIAAWVYLRSYGNPSMIYSEGNPPVTFYFAVTSGGQLQTALYNINTAGNWYFLQTSNTIPLNTWTFVAATLSNGGVATGNLVMYLSTPAFQSQSFAGQAESHPGTNYLGIGANIGNKFGGGQGLYGVNGIISNVQLYNTPLTSNQIAQLYNGGIASAPISAANVIAWWPLNGNTKDYSGSNYTGAPTGISYQNMVQINAQVKAGSGANAANAPIGAVTSKGALSQTGYSTSGYTNATGSQTFFLSSGASNGIANMIIDTFDDNLTTVGNLIGWWPLNEGYGSIAYDLSGRYDNGAFSNPSWTTFVNQTNLAAADFSGENSYITYPFNYIMKSVTIQFWAKTTDNGKMFFQIQGGPPNFIPLIYIEVGATTAGGTANQLVIYLRNDASAGVIPWNTGKIINNNVLHQVALTWDGYTATAYVDGAPVSNTAFSGILTISNPGLISTGNPYSLNGIISNVQFYYNTALTPVQIAQLYRGGPYATPVSDSGLADWWPLASTASDYSSSGNTGTRINANFVNVQYIAATTGAAVAQFNGYSSYITSNMPTMSSNSETQIAWVYMKDLTQPGMYAQITSQNSGAGGLYVDSSGYPIFGAVLGSTFNAVGSPVSIGTNQWHMLSGSYSGSNMSICIDGASCLTIPASGTLASSSNPFYIGTNDGASGFAYAEIADVQLYNTALTQTQIMQAYQQGLPMYSKFNVSLG